MNWIIENKEGFVFDCVSGVLNSDRGCYVAKVQINSQGKLSLDLGPNTYFVRLVGGLVYSDDSNINVITDSPGSLLYYGDDSDTRIVIKLYMLEDNIIPQKNSREKKGN